MKKHGLFFCLFYVQRPFIIVRVQHEWHPGVGWMLGQHYKLWPGIKPTSGRRLTCIWKQNVQIRVYTVTFCHRFCTDIFVKNPYLLLYFVLACIYYLSGSIRLPVLLPRNCLSFLWKMYTPMDIQLLFYTNYIRFYNNLITSFKKLKEDACKSIIFNGKLLKKISIINFEKCHLNKLLDYSLRNHMLS